MASDGRRIRPGMLVRSAHLSQAEDADLQGIASVIDLRTTGERQEAPDQAHGREYLPIPIFDGVLAGVSHEQETENAGIPDMAILYGRIVRECAASFRRVLLAVMEHDFARGAILWHCTEGKDRCGLTTALALEALGVDRDTILADYLKTNEVNLPKAINIRREVAAIHGEARKRLQGLYRRRALPADRLGGDGRRLSHRHAGHSRGYDHPLPTGSPGMTRHPERHVRIDM